MSDPGAKRPIDRKRESAGMIEVGTPDDPSAVKATFAINGKLHAIKENGIYEIKLADNIDPERLNPDIPNTQQRILTIGSNSELVGRTLLTAQKLFNKSYLPDSVDVDAALSTMFEILKNLFEMENIANSLKETEQTAVAAFDGKRRKDGSLLVPSIGDVPARFKAFIQNADHTLVLLLNVVKLFYGNDAGRRWFESLHDIVSARYGKNDGFAQFTGETLTFLKFVRSTRNCIEHPKEAERVIVLDFSIGADAKISVPQIEVVHPKTRQGPIAASALMEQISDQLLTVVELMIAFMCSRNVQPRSGFPIQVLELPEGLRQEKHVRFSYGIQDGERIIPAS